MRLPNVPTACLPALCLSALGLSVLGFGATACGSQGTAAATETPVYVLNFHGAEQGRSDQRPGDLVLSEFSTINKITWRSWGPTRATGTGKLTGTWCLPTCLDTPYDATVTLGNVIPVNGKGYFTKYEIRAELPRDQWDKADLKGVMRTP